MMSDLPTRTLGRTGFDVTVLGYGAMLFAQALGQKGIADCLARPELLPLWRRCFLLSPQSLNPRSTVPFRDKEPKP